MPRKAERKNQSQYVQYGCGMSPAEGWRNFDASPTLIFERTPFIGKIVSKNEQPFPKTVEYGDIVRGLPVSIGSCKAIYCSHVLEHLCLADCKLALRNTMLLLRPGGTFRAVLPDLEVAINNYLNDGSTDAAPAFMRETQFGIEKRGRKFKNLVKSFWGNSHHLWMWDYKSLALELEVAGFTQIRRAFYGDAQEILFHSAEQQDRWENCLGIECQKPA